MEFLKSYPTIHWNFVFSLHLFNDIVNHFRFFLLSFFSNSGWGFLVHHQGLSCDFERDCEKNSCNDTYSVVVFTGGCKLITEKVRCNIKMFFLISARYTSSYLNCFNCLLRLHSFVSYNRQEWKWISMDMWHWQNPLSFSKTNSFLAPYVRIHSWCNYIHVLNWPLNWY